MTRAAWLAALLLGCAGERTDTGEHWVCGRYTTSQACWYADCGPVRQCCADGRCYLETEAGAVALYCDGECATDEAEAVCGPLVCAP